MPTYRVDLRHPARMNEVQIKITAADEAEAKSTAERAVYGHDVMKVQAV